MERIGIYGGTFNPPHVGHIQAAAQAVSCLNLQKLYMIPDCVAPHKSMPGNTPTAIQRLEMLQIAVKNFPAMEVSDIELKREGVSYTWETIAQLRQIHPDAQLVLLMGTDMFLSFHTWMNPEYILKNASIGVLYRGEKGEREKIEAQKLQLEQQGGVEE